MTETVTRKQLYSMGWTKEMIKKYLPKPLEKYDPKGRASNSDLFDAKEVRDVMMMSDFFNSQRNNMYVRASFSNEKNLEKWIKIQLNKIDIVSLSELELFNLTIEHKKEWYASLPLKYQEKNKISYFDLDVIQRWEVNYIRHNLINYDETLITILEKPQFRKYYSSYKKEVLMLIKEKYSFLDVECDRQIKELEREVII